MLKTKVERRKVDDKVATQHMARYGRDDGQEANQGVVDIVRH